MKKTIISLVALGCIAQGPALVFATDSDSASKPEVARSVARPDSAEATSDALTAKRHSQEEVLLQFREQDWGTALEWLAEKLELNLDWKELPQDKVSLSSTQPLSLEAAEDMFNMQLLTRGFVLLKRDGVLRLVSLTDLDITLVPRVTPNELETLPKHSIARVSFPLEWMIAEEAAKELQPLLSPYGKVSPMASANRLEVVDAVVNLREFSRLLRDAENNDARRERVAEFRMKHRRVEDIAPKVRQLLGLPADNSEPANQMQLDIEEAKFKVEALKQMGRDARDIVQQDKKQTVFVTINEKENSLLVNAPPNKIEIVRQTVEAMDKPLEDKESAWQTISRVKVYDVSGFEPVVISRLVSTLQAQGTIDKDARLQFEPAYNRIIVFASPEDQLTVSQLMESFKAEKRTATVLPLSDIDPVYAAKAVRVILKAPDRPAASPGTASDGTFQVEPDSKNHRLLLWATSAELVEVREFLARLGETFSTQPLDSKLHIVEMKGQDTDEVTAKLQRIWAEISDTPLLLDASGEMSLPVDSDSKQEPISTGTNTAGGKNDRSNDIHFVKSVKESELGSIAVKQTEALPPVRLMKNGSGDLVILSKDPIAAETAKRLIGQLLKDKAQFRSISLEHAQATTVQRQLNAMLATSLNNVDSKLTTSNIVTIDVDPRTNRLIIQNADDRQWKMIKESTEILDQASPEEENLKRQRVTYRFEHRNAAEVAKALETAYADILRMNERTLASIAHRTQTFNQNMAATTANPEYESLLSFSVDEKANLLIISAPKYLIEEVLKLVESMDTAQDGNAIAILSTADLPFTDDTNASRAAANLRRLFGRR